MSVQTLIDQLVPDCPGWQRSTGQRHLLQKIQEALDELCDYDAQQMVFTDPDNEGFPPYLLTTDGVYAYDITAANLSATALTKTIGGTAYTVRAKTVLSIFIDVTNGSSDYNKRWIGEPYIYRSRNPYNTSTSRIYVSPVPARFYPALEDTVASIEFVENPGTTTEQYFCEFTWEFPRLTSETSPFPIAKRFESAIRDYVVGSVRMDADNKYNDRLERFERFWKPEWHKHITSGVSIDSGDVELMEC